MLKRLFDIVVSLTLLVMLTPLFLLLAVCIKLDSKGAILFRQERMGRKGVPFMIFKFRTMYVESQAKGALTVGEDKRITRVGKVIRDCRIDELIQLLNVLLGDMSLVGPRPEVAKYTNYHKKKWQRVLSVRPGITGLASILYSKQEADILAKAKDVDAAYVKKVLPKKLGYEVFYTKHSSLKLDLLIIWWTVKFILFPKKRLGLR